MNNRSRSAARISGVMRNREAPLKALFVPSKQGRPPDVSAASSQQQSVASEKSPVSADRRLDLK